MTIHVGDTDPDLFTLAEDGENSPVKLPRSIVRTIHPLTPLHSEEGEEEEESERARFITFVRGLSTEEWQDLHRELWEARPQEERRSKTTQASVQRRDRSTETLTLSREPLSPRVASRVSTTTQTSGSHRPARISQASQTARCGALLLHRLDQGVHLELADGSSITVPGPVQEVDPR